MLCLHLLAHFLCLRLSALLNNSIHQHHYVAGHLLWRDWGPAWHAGACVQTLTLKSFPLLSIQGNAHELREGVGCSAWTGKTCAGQVNREVQRGAWCAGCWLPGLNPGSRIRAANSVFRSVFWLNASQMFLFHLVFLHWLFPSTAVQLGLNLGAADAPSSAVKAGCRNGQNSNSLRWQKIAASCKCAQTCQWQQKQ